MSGNQTRNQHFVSQVEQRLNALNPGAKPQNQRIYEFEVVKRDEKIVRLTDARGRSIVRTLSFEDLFSFDVDRDAGIRANFEKEFNRYETSIAAYTTSLLDKQGASGADCKEELINLFVAKMVNFIRNPFCVTKVLNTFGHVATYHPTDPGIYAAYERVLNGRRPQQAALCTKLGISDEQYKTWLRMLFMLLTDFAHGASATRICSSLGRPAQARPGCRALSGIVPVATIAPCCISGCRGCWRHSALHVVTDAMPAC